MCVSFVMCRFGEDTINIHEAAATGKGPTSLATDEHRAGFDQQWVLLKRELESQPALIWTRVS